MPVKVRKPKARDHRITDEAVAAYIARDYTALHLSLGLPPWEVSPLDANRYSDKAADVPWAKSPWLNSVRLAKQLRRELEAAAKEVRAKRRSNVRTAEVPPPAAEAEPGERV